MLDKVAMITFLVIYIICLFIAIFMYLLVREQIFAKLMKKNFMKMKNK